MWLWETSVLISCKNAVSSVGAVLFNIDERVFPEQEYEQLGGCFLTSDYDGDDDDNDDDDVDADYVPITFLKEDHRSPSSRTL